MQALRAKLTDDAGEEIADIEGSIESPEEADGSRHGEFEFEADGAFMQATLEGKPFRLRVDDGVQLAIRVDSASTTARPGYTSVQFTCL
jgi:hypothetical protein